MRVPYCFFPENIVKRGSSYLHWPANFIRRSNPQIELDVKRAGLNMHPAAYISASLFSDMLLFVFILVFSLLLFAKYKTRYFVLVALLTAIAISGFIFFQQMTYPKSLVNKKVRGIERHLLSALRAMQIQVGSGIPLYNVFVSISKESYGGVSEQFARAVKEIDAGMHQINALESMASENPSIYFQRAVWQVVTAMKSGSDLGSVLGEIIKSLSEEQLVQVQDYGSKLNPLTMFYMLLVVVVPALAITFFVVLGSFLSINEQTLKALFWGMYFTVLLFQLLFISMISSKRPNMI